MTPRRLQCAVCGWHGTDEQVEYLPAGDMVCPACGRDEFDAEAEIDEAD